MFNSDVSMNDWVLETKVIDDVFENVVKISKVKMLQVRQKNNSFKSCRRNSQGIFQHKGTYVNVRSI